MMMVMVVWIRGFAVDLYLDGIQFCVIFYLSLSGIYGNEIRKAEIRKREMNTAHHHCRIEIHWFETLTL